MLSSLSSDFAVDASEFYGAIGKGEMSEAEMVEAVDECVRWRGGVAGDYRPSLSSLRVIRLLGPA